MDNEQWGRGGPREWAKIAMADTPVEVDVNTDNLDEFNLLLQGKAVEKTAPVEDEPTEDVSVDDADETDEQEAAEQDSDEAPDGDAGDADEDGEDEAEDDENILKPKPKKNTAKDRIDELTAEKYAERRRADELERRLAAMEARLREPEPKTPTQVEASIDAPDPDAVDKNGDLLYPLGEFDPKYAAALTKHLVQQDLAEARQQMQQEAQAAKQQEADKALTASWETKLNKSTEEIPDLRETIKSLDTHFADLEPQYGVYLAQTIMGLDMGPEVLYYLANNPDEADKIVASGPTGATLAIGRLEARIQNALAKKATPPVRNTAAPKPPANTRGTGARLTVRADTDDLDAFEKQFFKKG